MKKIILGKTGLEVTELCFGALNMGPLQKNLSVEEGSEIIAHGLKSGINFIDTAQIYKTYPHIRLAMEQTGIKPIISTKSPAASYEDMEVAINDALVSMDIKEIDIFFLHAARVTKKVFEEREGAFRCLMDYREKGILKSIGISTHVVEVVETAAANPEVDMVFPIINKIAMGVLGGSREDMEKAIELCHNSNQGILIMKALAGGNTVDRYKESMDYIMDFSKSRFSIALGMLNKAEVDMNIKYINGEDISKELAENPMEKKIFQVVPMLCIKCQKCIEVCHSDAVTGDANTPAKITDKCIKCGYCVDTCPQFAIRMV